MRVLNLIGEFNLISMYSFFYFIIELEYVTNYNCKFQVLSVGWISNFECSLVLNLILYFISILIIKYDFFNLTIIVKVERIFENIL